MVTFVLQTLASGAGYQTADYLTTLMKHSCERAIHCFTYENQSINHIRHFTGRLVMCACRPTAHFLMRRGAIRSIIEQQNTKLKLVAFYRGCISYMIHDVKNACSSSMVNGYWKLAFNSVFNYQFLLCACCIRTRIAPRSFIVLIVILCLFCCTSCTCWLAYT